MRLLFILLLAAAGGCSTAPPLAHTHSSAEAAAAAVLDALAGRDRTALAALAVSEEEFRDHVWPSLPAARPERNLPFSYVWGDLRQKSEQTLARTLAAHGGRRYALVAVHFEGQTDYGDYRIHRAATLQVRDETGATGSVRVYGSMINQRGRWKVFSYIVDN